MPPKKRPARPELSRLTVLAAGDEAPFLAYALELLASRDRLAREAALAALVERPLPDARAALRGLYAELDADGLKLDQGARMRVPILRILRALRDVRDADIGARASETAELLMGDDATYELRVNGLLLLADIAPDLLPYYRGRAPRRPSTLGRRAREHRVPAPRRHGQPRRHLPVAPLG